MHVRNRRHLGRCSAKAAADSPRGSTALRAEASPSRQHADGRAGTQPHRPPGPAGTAASRGRNSLPRPTWLRAAPPPRYLGCASRNRPVSARTLSSRACGAVATARPSRAAASDSAPAAAIAGPAAAQLRPPPRGNGGGPAPADGWCARRCDPTRRAAAGHGGKMAAPPVGAGVAHGVGPRCVNLAVLPVKNKP